MKAVLCTRYGPPEVLRLAEVDKPEPRPGQVRIRIHATSVTASDCIVRGLRLPLRYRLLMRLLFGFHAPRRPILGMVLAGEIDALGRGVTAFRVGDPVFGFSARVWGAYAQYVCWPASGMLAARPANLSFQEAAAIPYGGLLALYFIRKAGIQAGQRVLVYGASGAIGTAAVQIIRHAGAQLTGVCSTANLDLVESLGASAVIDYTREDFTRRPERYDVIFDAVGRRKSARALVDAQSALTPGGKICFCRRRISPAGAGGSRRPQGTGRDGRLEAGHRSGLSAGRDGGGAPIRRRRAQEGQRRRYRGAHGGERVKAAY